MGGCRAAHGRRGRACEQLKINDLSQVLGIFAANLLKVIVRRFQLPLHFVVFVTETASAVLVAS
ncbi:hypothetical protein CO614_08280 [Lysobacteraceae bacterium NML120232]|nr:hypothetical protein CO608_04990 [Xanthomonadaceae bacterium NML08-0793]PJK10778.1 hypothetical protein CO614_08280 [Xanthomonadaceae bacterium NML120232]